MNEKIMAKIKMVKIFIEKLTMANIEMVKLTMSE
jgi:hypothetical protein